MKAQLKDGFEIEVREECANDWSFLTMLRRIDKGDSGLIVDVAEVLLGESGVEKLAEHLRKDGVTHTDDMIAALTELMESVNELKN